MAGVKKSPIWSFHSVGEDSRYAICKTCAQSVSRGGKNAKTFNTSNLVQHLKNKHQTRSPPPKTSPNRHIELCQKSLKKQGLQLATHQAQKGKGDTLQSRSSLFIEQICTAGGLKTEFDFHFSLNWLSDTCQHLLHLSHLRDCCPALVMYMMRSEIVLPQREQKCTVYKE